MRPNDFSPGRILPHLQVVHDADAHSAAMNMAVDEALLQTARRPILRFYRWRRPSLSFGYFGLFAEVAAEELERELVRRWTGGGIVLHGADLTYSIILPRGLASELATPQAAYREIHGAIQTALAGRVDVVLADEAAPKISSACFANAVAADVLLGDRKIAGAAQRRTRAGLLHQGSVQHSGLPSSFPTDFAAALCQDFEIMRLAPDLLQLAEKLAEKKYATSEWLHQR